VRNRLRPLALGLPRTRFCNQTGRARLGNAGMTDHEKQRSIMASYKRWADAWSSVSIVLSIGLFIAAGYVMDETGSNVPDRLGAYILLATIIIVVVVWQALAFGLARLQIALTER
jgi:hypothetical protein